MEKLTKISDAVRCRFDGLNQRVRFFASNAPTTIQKVAIGIISMRNTAICRPYKCILDHAACGKMAEANNKPFGFKMVAQRSSVKRIVG